MKSQCLRQYSSHLSQPVPSGSTPPLLPRNFCLPLWTLPCMLQRTSTLGPGDFASSFNYTCSGMLDSTAPFTRRSTKTKPDPWLNDSTCALRQRCRLAEWRWEKDRFHVSLELLKHNLIEYQIAVKRAKFHYLSNISNSSNSPRVFHTINSVISPPNVMSDVSSTTCEKFIKFFLLLKWLLPNRTM